MSADAPDPPSLIAPCLIGLDIGTGSVRGLLIDRHGAFRAVAGRPTPTLHPAPDQAEYDPEAIWQAALSVLGELAARLPRGIPVAGIAVASMGESAVLIDDRGEALAPAIAWYDRRTEPDAARLAEAPGAERLFAITGLALDPSYTLCKLLWARRCLPQLFRRARHMLNLADWVAFRLTGERATDPSLASRTLCLDLGRRDWSAEVLAAADLDPALLPPIRPSGTALGAVRDAVLRQTGLPGRPVVGVGAHDHIGGGFAAGAGRPGVLLDSMGTAEAVFLTVTDRLASPEIVRRGYSQGAVAQHRPLAYLGAGIATAGGAIDWARRLFGGGGEYGALIAAAAAVPPGSAGVCFLPHLVYSTAPHPDLDSRGALLGLRLETEPAAAFRAVLEGLAMEARGLRDGMARLPGVVPPTELRAIGGTIRNRLLWEIKASVYAAPIAVLAEAEATALGAALLGGIAAGLWRDLDAARAGLLQEIVTIDPVPGWVERYAALHEAVYAGLYAALRPVNQALARLAGDAG